MTGALLKQKGLSKTDDHGQYVGQPTTKYFISVGSAGMNSDTFEPELGIIVHCRNDEGYVTEVPIWNKRVFNSETDYNELKSYLVSDLVKFLKREGKEVDYKNIEIDPKIAEMLEAMKLIKNQRNKENKIDIFTNFHPDYGINFKSKLNLDKSLLTNESIDRIKSEIAEELESLKTNT